jgi:predicted methyltransferase
MMRIIATGIVGLTLACHADMLVAQKESVRPGINSSFQSPEVDQFVGRFEREGRDVFDRRFEVLEACQLKPAMNVADIGAGTGLFTRLFAEKVGPDGKVYAVDIAENFVKHIEATSKQEGLRNIVGVVCDPKSSRLPANSVDLVFICDTYHHFEYPRETMRSIHAALRPGGQLVLIDFHRVVGVSRNWILDHVRAGQEVFTREIEEVGFQQIEEKKDLLEESYFLRFVKTDPESS